MVKSLCGVLMMTITIIAFVPFAKEEEYPIYAITGEGNSSTISAELTEILKNQIKNSANKIYILGNLHMTVLQSEDIDRDANSNIPLPLPSNIGDIGSDHPRILMVVKDNAAISSAESNLVTYQPSNVIQSTKNHKASKSDNIAVNCTNNISSFYYNESNISDSILANMKKIERLGNYSFGINNDIVYYLTYTHKLLKLINISEIEKGSNHLRLLAIKNFWPITQMGKIPKLLLYCKQAGSFYFYIYDVKDIHDYTFTLAYNDSLTFATPVSIRQATMYDNNIYYSEDGKGISQWNMGSNVITNIISLNTFDPITNYNIIDFVINEGATSNNPVAFCIVEHWGLFIYAINPKGSQRFLHPSLKKIDYFVNAIYGTIFIGVIVKQRRLNEEFFIEFLFASPSSKVKANKIFTGKNMDITSLYTPDLHYSYLYDKNSKSILIIRRGLVNKINFISYRFNVTRFEPKYIASVYDHKRNKPNLLLPSKDITYLLDNFSFPEHNVTCMFHNEGNYTLKLIQYTDACNSSIGNITAMSPINGCQKLMLFNIKVHGENKGYLRTAVEGWLIVVLILLCLVAFISMAMMTNCFKDNIFKLRNDRNKGNRAYCYNDIYAPSVEKDLKRGDSTMNEPLKESFGVPSGFNGGQFPSKFEHYIDQDSEIIPGTKSSYRSLKKSERLSNSELDSHSIIQIRKK